MELTAGYSNIKKMLLDPEVKRFTHSHFRKSLKKLGLSKLCVDHLINSLNTGEFDDFFLKYKNELDTKFSVGFYEKAAPDYFQRYVIPQVPVAGTLLDVGCGSGSLLRRLRCVHPKKELVGIDVLKYPQWSEGIKFQVVHPREFNSFLKKMKNYDLVMTWVLHHMPYEEQKNYLKVIYENIPSGSKIIVLEDAYSTELGPEEGLLCNKEFMSLSKKQRHSIMAINDWTANRILARRSKINIPFTFRTLEEWCSLSEKIGFEVITSKYIGFPKRDVDNPQALFVLKKS